MYNASTKASDISRQLSITGIAILWLFVSKDGDSYEVPPQIIPPLTFFALHLVTDLIQYIQKSIVTAAILDKAIKKDPDVKEDDFVPYSRRLNIGTNLLFILKVMMLLTGYILLIGYFKTEMGI